MIGVVGAGRMGGALMTGWVAGGMAPEDIVIVDPRPGEAAQELIAAGARNSREALAECGRVLLAVKPQVFPEVAGELAEHIAPDALVVSIMAGTTLAQLEAALPGRVLVRAMPNTPAAIGHGISAVFAPEGGGEAAEAMLAPGGAVLRVESERDIDRVTAVSGSGPAYVFHMVEALAAAGEAVGLSAEQAEVLARATVTGAGRLLEGGEAAGELRRVVTSPGGTTEAGLEVLMGELEGVMGRCVRAAYARAVELGDEGVA